MYYESIADFEATRAKCLSFHPIKPILLSSHHTSHIHAYDLHLASHIHTFLGHDGPVRAIIFHPRTEIFVSGGDDCKIILWSYSQKKKICELKGHTDYIRSLDFHPTQPWILSSSDDQTIRVWNLQTQKLLATVSGHSHYVMCVRFVGEYIVSCSLDQTLRIWDYTGLSLKKESTLLGVPNIIVKQIIEAHERGINHIVKHEDKNMFLTCGDDRQVKIWEYMDTVWEKDSLFNHQGNVSGGCFIDDNVVSVGEDGVICLGDSRVKFDTRFWCVAKNRDETLLAFGHDTGIKIFSTVQRALSYSYDGSGVYYKSGDSIIYNNLESEDRICRIKKSIIGISSLHKNSVGKYANCFLIQETNKFEVYRGKESIHKGMGKGLLMDNCIVEFYKDELKIDGNSVLHTDGVKNLIYYTPESFFIVRNKGVEIFSITEKKMKISIMIHDIEKIKIGNSILAFIARRKISFLDKKLKIIAIKDEMIEITDGFFKGDAFFYSTMRHIKFAINNYTGILRSIEKDVYLLFIKDCLIFYVTKDGLENVNVDLTEYEFELAMQKNDVNIINKTIKSNVLPIEIIINRLIKNNYSDLALPFIKEKKSDLLFEMNKLDECFENIKDDSNSLKFERLFEKSMKMKNYEIAENCLKRLCDYQRLMILYVCRNQLDKLEDLKKVDDVNIRMGVAVILKDKALILEILSGNNKKSRKTFEKTKSNCVIENKVEKMNINTSSNFKKSNNITSIKVNQDNKKDNTKFDKIEKVSVDEIDIEKKNNFNYKDLKSKECMNRSELNKIENSSKPERDLNNEKVCDKTKDEFVADNLHKSKVIEKEELFAENNVETNSNDKGITLESYRNDVLIFQEQNTITDSEKSIQMPDFSFDQTCESESINSEKYNVRIEDESAIFYKDDVLLNETEEASINLTFIDKTKIDLNGVRNDINYEESFNLVIENTTSGKFTTAINICQDLVFNIANAIKSCNEEIDLRKNLGIYISGLTTEKKKKKQINNPLKYLIMSSYFPSLSLRPEHKNLALSNLMVHCYKSENYDQAKEIASELLKQNDVTFAKNAKKILKSSKTGNKYHVKKGKYCFDVEDVRCVFKTCQFCFTNSESGVMCVVCKVGILK